MIERVAPRRSTVGSVRGVALWSALVTAFSLGLAIGLPFRHGLLRLSLPPEVGAAPQAIQTAEVLADLWPILMAIGGAVWGYLLGRVTGYRQPWRLLLGGFLGVSLGASLGTMGVFGLVNALLPGAPVHVRFGLAFPLIIDATALAAGLALGIAAFRGRALPHLGMAAGLSAAAPSAIVVLALELLGVRVGGGNAAMAKVAALGFLAATLASGAVIGVVFARRVVRQE